MKILLLNFYYNLIHKKTNISKTKDNWNLKYKLIMVFWKFFGRAEKMGLRMANKSHVFVVNCLFVFVGYQIISFGKQYNDYFKEQRVNYIFVNNFFIIICLDLI